MAPSKSLPSEVDLSLCLDYLKQAIGRYSVNGNISHLNAIKLKGEVDMLGHKIYEATQGKHIICETKGCINLTFSSIKHNNSSKYCERCLALIGIYGNINGFEVHKP